MLRIAQEFQNKVNGAIYVPTLPILFQPTDRYHGKVFLASVDTVAIIPCVFNLQVETKFHRLLYESQQLPENQRTFTTEVIYILGFSQR
jgi:hypothetical protein